MAATQPPGGPGGDTGFGTVGEGRYRLIRRLGRGGMADVLLADDVRLGRPVAVKLLRPELAEDDVARQRFTREAQSVAGLNHHAVVAVYDTGEDVVGGDTVPYIVMELVEGKTIRDLLVDADEPPVEQALIVASGVLDALGYSHRMGIVHRDIKPANVIITNDGAVKVMDFGIARALGGGASTMTQTGMVMGTPQYLSPEQALGKAIDARSDLYATGCLLYELLTLRPPFTGETPLSVVYQHVQDPPVPPSQANPRVPPELDGLVLRALAKDPDERYQSADEFRAALQHALFDLTGTTGGLGLPGMTAGAGMAGAGAAAAAAAYRTPPGGHQAYGATPVAGTTAPTQGMPPGGGGPPVLLDGDDGDGGPRRSRKALAAVAAVVAVVAAIILAVVLLNGDDGKPADGETTRAPKETTSSPSEKKETSESPDEETSESTPEDDEPESPSQSQGTGNGGTEGTGSSSPTTSPSTSPTTSPSASPTPTETDDDNGGPGGGEDNGGGGGDDGGSSSESQEPSDPPPPTEDASGGTAGGGTDAGAGGADTGAGEGDQGGGTT